MSERETSIHPRTADPGNLRGMAIAAHGRQTRAEMIERFRAYHRRQKATAEAALALSDDELIVETYLGAYVQRNRQEVTQ